MAVLTHSRTETDGREEVQEDRASVSGPAEGRSPSRGRTSSHPEGCMKIQLLCLGPGGAVEDLAGS